MSGTKAKVKQTGIVRDDSGAIMIVGLLMGLNLTAALWFLMGMGNEIYQREAHQEIVDSAAFSDTVIHARGMNYVSMVNLMEVALAANIVSAHRLALAYENLRFAGDQNVPFAVSQQRLQLQLIARKAYDVRANLLLTGDPSKVTAVRLDILSTAIRAVAIGAPAIGTEVAYQIGKVYEGGLASKYPNLYISAVGVGPSNRGRFDMGVSATFNSTMGLPVAHFRLQNLCSFFGTRITAFTRTVATSTSGDDPNLDAAITSAADNNNGGVPGTVVGGGTGPVSGGDQLCINDVNLNGGGFGGAYIPANLQNGDDDFQVWAFERNLPIDRIKSSERTGIVPRVFGGIGAIALPEIKPATFSAQGEFYFDCVGRWSSANCNGSAPAAISFATYHLGWKARLRTVRRPEGDPYQRVIESLGTLSATNADVTNNARELPLDEIYPTVNDGPFQGTFQNGLYH
ncbi:MAG: hypothetical protein KBF88_08835 [Polyangiaceae bacterium]|nr:hypothetical protein [Polyangiaceae bacterium]